VAADFSSLDVYSDGRREGSPVLVFVHGGGWVSGNKSNVQRSPLFLRHYAERGVVVVSVGLRLVKGAGTKDLSFREQATDIAAALKWVHDNIRDHKGDPRRVFLMGYSAGAHLVALVGSDPSYLQAHGLEPSFLRGVISLDVNAYDIPQAIMDAPSLGVPISPANLRRVFTSDLAMQKAASPALHVTPGRKYPAMLICYIGVFDTSPEGVFNQTLTKVQSEKMVNVLRDAGARAEIFGDLAQSHRGIMRDFGKSGDPLTAAVDRFMFGPTK
jgi:acetyl esterase/lipase